GNVFREASLSLGSLPTSIIVHSGDTIALSVMNASAADGFSEGLITKVTGTTGGVTATAPGELAGGASGTVTLGFPSSAGTVSGTATLDFLSDGSVDGNTNADLGSQVITVNATVDNYAVAAISETSGGGTFTQTNSSTYTLNLGNITQG